MLQPHAVIAMPNNVEIDARAHRNGLALAAAGYRVTMVGYGTGIPAAGTISGLPYHLTFGAAPPAKKLTLTYRLVRKSFHLTTKRRPPQEVLKVVAKVDAVTNRVKSSVVKARSKVSRPAALPAPDPTTWQGMLPFIGDIEKAMMPRLVELQPDLIVCDVHLLHLAHEVANRFRGQGKKVAVLYDAREYVYGLASEDENVLKGFPALEAEHIRACDAVVTVCEPIAEFLADKYDIPTPPLVPNAPIGNLPAIGKPMTIRDFVDVGADTPLLAYAGGLSVHRGVHDAVEALAELPGVHLAIGARRPSSYTLELEELAIRHGVRERVHFVPFAPTHEVADYLASATAAIFPFLPVGNHVWAAPNKYFESVQARLPILTSNMEWLGERIPRLGIGEVFEHSNPASLAAATRKLLDNIDEYRARITDEMIAEHTFEHFADTVQSVCLAITPAKLHPGLKPGSLNDHLLEIRKDMLAQRATLSDSNLFEPRPRLRIGTSNSGGQSRRWAHALMRDNPRAIAESVWLQRSQRFSFPVDEVITEAQSLTGYWQRRQMERYEDRITHVLSESGRPLVGAAFGKHFWQETAFFRTKGIRQGLVFHGSDIRNPRRHVELEPYSPFGGELSEEMDELTEKLQRNVDVLAPHVNAFDGPVHVTTMDLLDHLPGATWLPLVVDVEDWSSDIVPLSRDAAPMVFHVPNKDGMKGSEVIDEVCEELQAQGVIRYVRESGVSHEQMRTLMLESDIVIDQLRIGDYGITAVEAMSAGKVVIGHLSDRVADRYPDTPPVVRATPDNLREVLDAVLSDPARAEALGRAGRDYVLTWHDGRAAAAVLADFMEL
ncbi:MAG: glycosyltransferase [Propionibacteriaceae bacterium]|nr:glycosyltransferase [Propionibacteriaceae bacterium]